MRVMMAADAVAKRPCSRPWGHSTSLTHRTGHSTSLTHRTVRWANALRWAADEMANEEIARRKEEDAGTVRHRRERFEEKVRPRWD